MTAKAARRELAAWRTGPELGEELTCSRPGSEWAPRERPSGALGSPIYQPLQGCWARRLLCHLMGWRPQEGGCHRNRATPLLSCTLAGPSCATGVSVGRG